MDFDKNICLLCKRSFKNGDQIKRHRSLSKLHSSRSKKLRKRLFSQDQLDRIERKEREALYRDRAKERRLKYGQTDRLIPVEPMVHPTSSSQLSKPGLMAPPTAAGTKIDSASKPLGTDNKGATLLSKMGWREGTGLGKTGQGRTEAIKLESQIGTSGLGSKSYKVDPGLSYKEAVKKIMYQRYHEIDSDEDTGVG